MKRNRLKNTRNKTTTATSNAFHMNGRSVVVLERVPEQTAKDSVWLYAFVYKHLTPKLAGTIFCVSFLLQPVAWLQASETEPAPAITQVEENVSEPTVITELVEPIVISQPDPDVIIEVPETIPEGTPEVAELTPDISEESNNLEESSEFMNSSGTQSENIIDPAYQYQEVESESVSPRDSEGQFIENLHVVAVVDSEDALSFARNECTKIDDGSFYCQEQTADVDLVNTLLAAPDETGDLEIFVVRDKKQTQLTFNAVDDASPYYDEKSEMYVWHRLIDDRYQIISYDPKSDTEYQLTQGSINNMEPAKQGEFIVWQRWVDDNWEIMLYDGISEFQITNSKEHDTAPHINGALIIWNSQAQDGTRTLKTFNLETKSFTTISDTEGVAVSNPRMVVMYEALYENGDVIMKGFDIMTGEIIPLHSLPAHAPEQLPESDSTGETRALIQSKPNVRDGGREGEDLFDPIIIPPIDEVDEFTLDLRQSEIGTSTAPVPDIPVLIIPPIEILPEVTASTQVE